ncbi:MAG: right-handed parallel beta-helix repeat-containing protein [Aeromicrobium sp.]|jgi:hypothetical protein|nr:MAG: right-handed parallel beta-helix repeat-containing protein [Aeromicrobium sp.]
MVKQRVQNARGRRAAALASAAAIVGTSFFVGMPTAMAAPDAITVTSLGLAGNAVAGVCEATTGAGNCTLRGALEIANASTNPDGVEITFASALSGTGKIVTTGGDVNSMYTSRVGNPAGNLNGAIGQNGARFLVDSDVPVSIDFTNLDGIDGQDWHATAGFYVKSDDVVLENLTTFRAAEAGIAVGGSNVDINDVNLSDTDTVWGEIGVAFLDGASDVTLNRVTSHSMYWANYAVDTAATVSNIRFNAVRSAGVHAWAHIDIEDGATVNGFVVDNSVLGASSETSPTHGFWMNPNITVTGLQFTNSQFLSPGQNGLFFEGSGQNLTNTRIVNSEFTGTGNNLPGYDAGNISRVIGNNTGTWNGLTFEDNTIDQAQAVKFGGTVRNATFVNNTFSNVNDPAFAALHLGNVSENITVANNEFDRIWAHDTIRVEGTSAENVVIEDNDIFNLTASVSRAAIGIYANGTGNRVRNNNMQQDISGAPGLPDHVDNHWAIWNEAQAATATDTIGWQITNNHIEGFGGKDRSQAPIVNNARGKLLVTGNTFGPHTRGGVTTDVEHSAFWFLWNVHDSLSNNTVQTFRAENVALDGTNATFTAVQPAPLIGNNAAVGPVTLHVYWTAADNAEVYLGAITDVNAGESVSIPATQTNGFIRLQTVDANGNTSQYSALDPDAPSQVPAAPSVGEVTEDTASGTGTPGANVVVRDESDEEVASVEVAPNGEWTVSGLQCETGYTVTQVVGGISSGETAFTTATCGSNAGPGDNGDGNGDGDGDGNGSDAGDDQKLDATGMPGGILGGVIAGILALMAAGAAFVASRNVARNI